MWLREMWEVITTGMLIDSLSLVPLSTSLSRLALSGA